MSDSDDTLSPDSALAQRLLDEGFTHTGKELSKGEALRWAAKKVNLELLQLLIQEGADVNSKGDKDESAFMFAAESGDCDLILALHKAGVDMEAGNTSAQSALHYAAIDGREAAVRLLVNELKFPIEYPDVDGWTPFLAVARTVQTAMLGVLRELGANIDAKDNTGRSALHHAAIRGSLENAKLLIEWSASPSPADEDDYTPLHRAIIANRPSIVRYLVEIGADISAINNIGRNALHTAAWEGKSDLVETILQPGTIDLEAKDGTGDTALSLAAYRGNTAVVSLLVQRGAALDCVDNRSNSLLHNATRGYSFEVIDFLMKHNADIEARNGSQATPLLFAARNSDLGMNRYLEKYGANLYKVDKDDYTALHLAVMTGNLKLVRHYVRSRVSLEAKTKWGQSALSLAAEEGFSEIVTLLLDSRADIETEATQAGCERWRPLHYAVSKGHEAVVEILLERGADGFAKDADGRTALYLAEDKDHTDIAKLIRRNTRIGGKVSQAIQVRSIAGLIYSAGFGDAADLKRSIEEGVDVNAMATDGNRALIEAAKRGKSTSMLMLLEAGADPNLQDLFGMSALWWACWMKEEEVVRQLLSRGASTEVADQDNQTPLAAASLQGYDGIVQILLDHGANPNTPVTYGMTPLIYAVNEGHTRVVELLVNANVDMNYAQPDGETALSLAKLDGNDEIVRILETKIQEGNGPSVSSDKADDTGYTAHEKERALQLSKAARKGRTVELERLLKLGTNMNLLEKSDIPLILAAKHGQVHAVVTLLSHGAQVDKRDDSGRTALHYAAWKGQTEIIRHLHKHGATINSQDNGQRDPLSLAAEAGRKDASALLLELGSKLDHRDDDGQTPLWHAAQVGHTDIVELLVNAGANINSANHEGFTPLSQAVDERDFHTARLLLEKGARMIPVPETNYSPLCLAVYNGDEDIIELLNEYRADIDHLSNSRRTPLMIAAEEGHGMVVRQLIEMGARADAKDDDGRTALSYAKENRHGSLLYDLCNAAWLRERNERALRRTRYEELSERSMYQYSRLQESGQIRIMELHPGEHGDVISFELHDVDLSRVPSYEALSYEWQERQGNIPVQCGEDRVHVTPNCKAALESLRYKDKSRMLWIDAVCIDQSRTQEVNEQVSMFTDIYRKAKNVIMWLGEDEDETEKGFDAVQTLAGLYPLDRAERHKLLNIAFDGKEEAREALASIKPLYDSSYWERAWIFQEIILAGSRGVVYCGPYSCNWDMLRTGLLAYEQCASRANNLCFKAIVGIDNAFKESGGADITTTIAAMTTFQATDPRDKVYATLRLGSALLTSQQLKPPAVDYELTVQEVYMEAARYYVHVRGSPGWGLGNRPSKKVVEGLPSWVPDFDYGSRRTALETYHALYGRVNLTSTDLRVGRAPAMTRVSLHIGAYIVDDVIFSAQITREKDIYDIVNSLAVVLAEQGHGIYDPLPRQDGLATAPATKLEDTIFAAMLRGLLNLRIGDEERDLSQDSDSDSESDIDEPDEGTRTHIAKPGLTDPAAEDSKTSQNFSEDDDKASETSSVDDWITVSDHSVNGQLPIPDEELDQNSSEGDSQEGDMSDASLGSPQTFSYKRIAAFLAWKLSIDSTTPELSKHIPPYLESLVRDWNDPEEKSEKYLEQYADMENSARYDTDIFYTTKGYFGITNGNEAAEGLVVALVSGDSQLSLLRPGEDGQQKWYEYVDDAIFTHLSGDINTLDMLDATGRIERIVVR